MRTNPEELEAHYCKSPFVKEVCVRDRYAVVVPDMDLMRMRKIVNVGDLLRFELEGLSHGLPPAQRLQGYEIWFESLPRTITQTIDRDEVERRVRERRQLTAAPLSEGEQAWLANPDVATVVQLIRARVRGDVRIRPDANLEIDLGLDSMERVELIAELESQLGVMIPKAACSEIYTVGQLIDTVRSAEAARGSNESRAAQADHSARATWTTILRDLPDLGWLLRKRTFLAPLLWILLRIARWLLVRVTAHGLDKLPAQPPYIIAPNHQSYVDPFIVCSVLPYRVFKDVFQVGAVEYFETPFTRWVARTANLVPVDPDSNLVPAMQAGAFGLLNGKILMIFPEGERSIDGTVRKFKKGAPILAQHLGVPVVPVALKGIHELWPRNRGINWRLMAPWSGHRVSIAIGEPIALPGGANYSESAARLRSRVTGMWEALSS